MNKILMSLFLYSCLFPWVSFGILNLDIQPYFILLSGLVLMLNLNVTIKKEIWLLSIVPMFCFILALFFGEIDFSTVRALVSYSSVFLVSAALYVCRKKYIDDIRKHLYYANIIWLVAGIIQVVFGKQALEFLVVVRTTAGRGVTGLAPEPTFYAVFLIFISWLIIKENSYNISSMNVRLLLVLNLLTIVLVAKSSMGLLFVFLLLLLYVVFNYLRSVKNLIFSGLAFFGCVLCLSYISNNMANSRLGEVVNSIKADPFLVVYNDASVNERAKHIVYPIHGTIDNWFLPSGFHQFSEKSDKMDVYYDGFFWWGESSNKIMSALGAAFFELGFIAFLYFVYMFKCCYYRLNRDVALFEFAGITMIMFAAIPISFPLFSMLLVSSYFRDHKN